MVAERMPRSLVRQDCTMTIMKLEKESLSSKYAGMVHS